MHPRSLLRQLTRIPIEQPCATPWETMVGGEKVRHCPSCDRDVWSLSDMTELEAELRLLNSGEAVPCIRYARDSEGQVAHRPPPTRRFLLPSAAARAVVVASALATRGAFADEKANDPTQCVMLSGLVAETPAPAPAAPSAAAPAPPPAPPHPIPLAGAPPPPREPVAYGSLTVRSKVPRDLDIQGIKLKAPLSEFRMTPGNFVVKVEGKKKRSIKFTIKLHEQTIVDLDKK